MNVFLKKESNDFFREWIIKEWQHHNTVDPIYQLKIIDPSELDFNENEEYYQIIYDNIIVGLVGIKIFEYSIYLYRFYIDEKYRNKGIGTNALKEIIKLAKKENKDLSLDVFGNNAAKKLYEKLGFKDRYTNMVFKITSDIQYHND